MAALATVLGASAVPVGAQPSVLVSCEGTESNGGGLLQYQYEFKNFGGAPVTISRFDLGCEDGNLADYLNWLMPQGWNATAGPGGFGWANVGVKTPHGAFAPVPGGSSAHVVFWDPQNVGVVLNPGQTVLFGFDNPNNSENVDWLASNALGGVVGANWASAVAGPIGVFTDGPIHAPVPEPATLALLALGGAALVRRLRVAPRTGRP
jgi:hypothetical protein